MKKILLITIALIGIITTYIACRKTEVIATSASIEEKFFNNHPTSDVKINTIINYLKRKNSTKNFIDKTVERIGYPFWDKSIVLDNLSKTNKSASDSGINVYIIPFVRDNQNVVNACLQVIASTTDTTLKYLCDWQYHDSASVGLSARKQSLLLMQLDKNIFGSRLYKITDSAAFGVNSANKAVQYVKLQSSNQQIIGGKVNSTNKTNSLLLMFTICDVYYVPKHEGQLTGCKPGAKDCNDYTEEMDCQNYYFWASESGGGDSGGNEGDTGYGDNSSTGGGDADPPPPCNGLTGGKTNQTDNPPPCEPGWEPVEEEDNTTPSPCDKANNLKNDSVSISKFKYLKSLVTGNHEEAFAIPQSPNDPIQHFVGTSNDKKVKTVISKTIKTHLHNHYQTNDELPIFSSDDFDALATFFTKQKIIHQVFTMGVTTSFGTQYVIVIDNPVSFENFINAYIFDENTDENLPNLYTRYGIHSSSSIVANELGILKLFRDKNTGIKILKADANFTQFEELSLNREGNTVTYIPCN